MDILTRESDFARLAEVLSSWIEVSGPCGYYHVGDLRHWIRDLLGERADRDGLVRAWRMGATLSGFAVCGLFDAAFEVFVDPALRGSDVERRLVGAAHAITLEDLNRRAALGEPGLPTVPITDVFDCDVVRQQCLEELGYRRYRVWDHITERQLDEALPAASIPAGFAIRTADPADGEAVARLVRDVFGNAPSSWMPVDSTTWTVLAVAPNGDLASMATVHVDRRNRVGLFEPVATQASYRRHGLARAVLLQGLRDMLAAGMGAARVSYDAMNSNAAELYRGLGFSRRFTTWGYRASDEGLGAVQP